MKVEIGGDMAQEGNKKVGGDVVEEVKEDEVVAGCEMVGVDVGEEVGGVMVGTLKIITIKGTKIVKRLK